MQYCEVGVVYSREYQYGHAEYKYQWTHLSTGKTGISSVFMYRSHAEFLKLIDHWNRDPRWKYNSLT